MTTPTDDDLTRLMREAQASSDRRAMDDEHTRSIVKMTVAEIFEGVGVDLASKQGRERFRAVYTWGADAMDGAAMVRKTTVVSIVGIFLTGAGFGIWEAAMWFAQITARVKGGQ